MTLTTAVPTEVSLSIEMVFYSLKLSCFSQVRGLTFDSLQRKVKGLEDDNRKLRAEASQLASDSSESEEKEEQLLREVVAQLSKQFIIKITKI